MEAVVDLLFQARMLKEISRTGYPFLGVGKETVADHSYLTGFIAFVMSEMDPEVDARRLMTMCLLHDLWEARTGDLNYLQKKYVTIHERRAVADTIRDVPFGPDMAALAEEFNQCRTRESRLAHDADQLAFMLDLKSLMDRGYKTPEKWLAAVRKRLVTETGNTLADWIVNRNWDDWWLKNYVDTPKIKE